MSGDPAELTLAEAAAAVATGQVSSTELTRACLDRIRVWQPRTNAFLAVDETGALRQARERDEERARGRLRGPLHGVPLAHKDLVLRRGRVSTAGSLILRNTPATTTSTLLERLDAAGAVEIGTLHMSEFAAGPTGHNVHFDHCRNPYHQNHVPGGSSSGSGAAVAARLVFGALGSDTGGSIRLPASACGVVGLKPTYGRVTRHGTIARSWSLDHLGPLARTARDCALLLSAIAGYDSRDATSSSEPVPDYAANLARTSLADFRIAVPADADRASWHPDIADALHAMTLVLRELRATVTEVRLPDMGSLLLLAETVIKAEAAALHRTWIAERPGDYAAQVRKRIEAGFGIPATQYIDALRLREPMVRSFLDGPLREADALCLPVMSFPVPTIVDTDIEQASGEGIVANVARMTTLTRPFNYLGLPALSIPAGFCGRGLPIGIQLVGHPFAEGNLLCIANAVERVSNHHRAAPAL